MVSNTHGGHRTPGPGKHLGRPPKSGIVIKVKVRCTDQAHADAISKLTPEQRGEMMTGETKMNFKQAVKQMAAGMKSDAAIQAIYDAVEPKCKTSTEGDTTLRDWLSETGGYTGSETPASIAKEWDDQSE